MRSGSDPRVIHLLLRDAAATAPDKPLAVFLSPSGERSHVISRQQLWERSSRTAAALDRAQVGVGARVALLLDNRPEFLDLFMGCSIIGAVTVPLNTALKGASLEQVLTSVEPTLIFCEPELLDVVQRACVGAEAEPQVVAVGSPSYEAFCQGAGWHPDPDVGEGDLASIMFTSGTTGPSKGVMCPHGMVVAMGQDNVHLLSRGADDIAYTCLPLFHVNALWCSFVGSLVAGGTVVIDGRFSVSRFWQQVQAAGATSTNLLGGMANLLVAAPVSDAEQGHHLRTVYCVPTPSDYDGFETRFQVTLTSGYGLTDGGTPLGVPPGQRRPGSCGRPLPSREVGLVDEYDRPVADGVVGELVYRPGRAFDSALGYWRMPDATVAAWRNLWLHTGDLLRRDAEGWYYFVDRAKDAVRRHGENVSCFEVEAALSEHPAVLQVAVFGVPAAEGEEEVMACVVLTVGSTRWADIRAHCEERLPYFAVPRYFRRLDALPRNPLQKVAKAPLKETGVTADTWDAGSSARSRRQQHC